MSETTEAPDNRVQYLNAYERETIVNASDGDDIVRIWTAQRRAITRLRSHAKVTEVASGVHGSTEWAQFEVPAAQWNPVTGVKRTVVMTEKRREQAREALKRAREA